MDYVRLLENSYLIDNFIPITKLSIIFLYLCILMINANNDNLFCFVAATAEHNNVIMTIAKKMAGCRFYHPLRKVVFIFSKIVTRLIF